MTNPIENIEDVKAQFIDRISDSMNAFGVSTTVGRILGIIYLHGGPMTLDELSMETGMSKTRMSQVVREMVDMDMLERVFKKGVRKDLYQVDKDHYDTFISLFNSTWQKAITRNRSVEQRLKTKLNHIKDDPDLTEKNEEVINELLKEIQEWMDYHDWVRRVAEFFESGEIYNYVPKKETKNSQ